jgi:hypothetical protein
LPAAAQPESGSWLISLAASQLQQDGTSSPATVTRITFFGSGATFSEEMRFT